MKSTALATLALLFGSALLARAQDAAPAPPLDPKLLESLEWRSLGPSRGGRSAAVAGIPQDRHTYYFGACGGGVWKTTDAGASWKNVSDGFFGGSIGAVAVSEWDPNVVYAGGGEKTVRGNVSHGDGIWKSVDAGKTWAFAGLPDSRHVTRIRVHPKDPNLVYAAVLGHLYGPNETRGVYRSTDGGATWDCVHFVNVEVGAVDLAMDPANPRVLYASMWRVRRTPFSLSSGGDGSSLWKSADGGDTWTELSKNEGFPKGTLGIIGVSVSASDPENVYAIVEAEEGGVVRSRDGGKTWVRTNEDRALRQRAWYYSRLYADPKDSEVVYVLNVEFHRSKDGGKTFESIPTPHSDNHDLWIDPNDPLRMIEANDGGANVSNDGGKTWSTQANQPTAQFYRVTLDSRVPYRIYGAQQDNSTVRLPVRPGFGLQGEFEVTAGGESGHIAPHPVDPEIVFGGSYGGYLTRLDHRTGVERLVDVWPDNPIGHGAEDSRYRFQWNFPIFFSPHPPHALYAAANVLFRSDDEGQSWKAVSPDLTRNDRTKLGPSGGPITKDNTSVEYYCTIFAALESPHEKGVLWAGSDDGLLHVTRDGGANWANVTPPGLPEWSQINSIEAHPFEKGGLYVAATSYKWDDFAPCLFKTTDYGATWTRIDSGIDALHFTRVVRADPVRRGLLYAGTERGVYVSIDDGARWQPLQRNLPIVPITDLAISRDGDLVAATQGRSFWVLDDLSPLRALASEIVGAEPAKLLAPRPVARLLPSPGATLHYHLEDEPAADAVVKLEILDASGAVVRRFERKPADEKAAREAAEKRGETLEPPIPAKAGMNKFTWDLRAQGARRFPGMVLWSGGGLAGPVVPPGTYAARLTAGDAVREVPVVIAPDPRLSVSGADLEAQYAFLVATRDAISLAHDAVRAIREMRAALASAKERAPAGDAGKSVRDAADAIEKKIGAIEETLYQTKNKSPQDPLNFPNRLTDKLASVAGGAASAPARPTESAVALQRELVAAIDAEVAKLAAVREADLPAFNALAKDLPAVK